MVKCLAPFVPIVFPLRIILLILIQSPRYFFPLCLVQFRSKNGARYLASECVVIEIISSILVLGCLPELLSLVELRNQVHIVIECVFILVFKAKITNFVVFCSFLLLGLCLY